VLTFEITEPDTRDIFNGLLGLLGSLAGMTGPFFAGWVITRMNNTSGYTFIFSLSLALFIVAVILSFLLKRRSVEGDFKLKQVLRWGELSENWRSILLANFAQGVREGSFAFLIFVWVFIAAGTELALGTYSLITSAISFVLYYVVGRFIPTRYRPVMMLVGALLLSASVFFIAFEFTFTRLIIFGVLVAIAYPMIMVPLISLTYDVIGQAKHAAQWRIEYVVGRELFLNGGRVVSILLFLAVLGLFNDEQGLPYFIMLVGQAQLFVYYFIRHVHLKETNRIKKRAS
jgi:YQGE family putative transporter